MQYKQQFAGLSQILPYKARMQTTSDFGRLVATRRRELKLKQKKVAVCSGLSVGLLSRFERGHLPELGVRKLISLLTVLDLELQITERRRGGNLDELREEHSGRRLP